MLFSSISFLYYFLPCVLILYFLSPRRAKNAVLLVSSLVFYGWGEPVYLFLMLASIAAAYLSGLFCEKYKGTKRAKTALTIGVAVDLGFLVYFKYANFFIENFSAVTGISVSALRIALPIGISFYTFQAVSYIIDVYRGEVAAQRNPINLAAYVTMFPQLIAGPIVRYSNIEHQLQNRKHSVVMAYDGVRRFVLGLGKKILIANALGEVCEIFRQTTEPSVLFYWMYGIAFSLHIYFDFSGYSDMAIGLGKIFGFDFLENFNYPYISRSATEFWRRWHMSLGSWFRDYVYIPLGGNRVGRGRWLFNILLVWMLTGFWHGAAWNFVIWGLFFAVLLIAEKLFLKKFLDKSRVISRIYLLFAVMLSFIIFNAPSLAVGMKDVAGLFGAGGIPLVSTEAVYYLRSFATVFILAFIGATPLVKQLVTRVRTNQTADKIISAGEPIILVLLLVVMTAELVDGSFNPFLYFRF